MIYAFICISHLILSIFISPALICLEPHEHVNLRYHHLLTSSSAFAVHNFQQEMIDALDAHVLHNDANKTRTHLETALKSIDLMSKTIEPFFVAVKGTSCESEPYLALSLLKKINKKIRAQLLKFEKPLSKFHEPDLIGELAGANNAKLTQDLIAIFFMMRTFTCSLAHDVLPDYKKPLVEIARKLAWVKQLCAAGQQDKALMCSLFNEAYRLFVELDEMLEQDDMKYPLIKRARTNIHTIFLSVIPRDQRYLRQMRMRDLAPQEYVDHIEAITQELFALHNGLRTKYNMLSNLPSLLQMSLTNENEIVSFLQQMHELSQHTLAVTFSGDAQENILSTSKDTFSSWLRNIGSFWQGKAEAWQGRGQSVKKFHSTLHKVAHEVDIPSAIAGLLKARHTPGPLRFIEYCLTDTGLGAQAIGMMLLLVAPDKMELIQKQLNEGRSIALIADELRRCISMFNLDHQADALAHFLQKYRSQVGLISSKVSEVGLGLAERKLESVGTTFEGFGRKFQNWSQLVGKQALSKENFMYWCNGMAAQGALNMLHLKAEAQKGSVASALLVACEKNSRVAHDAPEEVDLAASGDEGHLRVAEAHEPPYHAHIFQDRDNERFNLLKKVFEHAGMESDMLRVACAFYAYRYQEARDLWLADQKMKTLQQDTQKLLAYSQQTRINPHDIKKHIQIQVLKREGEFWHMWHDTRIYHEYQDAQQERKNKEFRFHEARRKYEALLRSIDGVENYMRREEMEIEAIKRAYWLLSPLGYLKRRGKLNNLAFWQQKKAVGIAAMAVLFEEWAEAQKGLEQAREQVDQKKHILEELEKTSNFSGRDKLKHLDDEDFAFVLGQMSGI